MSDIQIVMSVESDDVLQAVKNTKKLEREIQNLDKDYGRLAKAQNTGLISAQNYAKGVAQVDAKIAKLHQVLGSGSTAINKHATALVQSKQKMSKFGMVSQQVGYQVGDFFVQIQSGTSALVAFGQQGTQLAGLLPGVAGAVVGIGLAVSTMLLRSFQQASGEAKTLAEAMEKVQESFDDYTNAIDTINDLDIQNKFGSLASSMKNMAKDSARFAENMIFSGLEQAANKLDISSKGFFAIFEQFYDRITDTTGNVYSAMSGTELSETKNLRQLGLEKVVSVDVYKGFIKGLKEASQSNDAQKSFDLLSEMRTRVVSGLTDKEMKDLNENGQKFIATLEEQAKVFEQLVNLEQKLANSKLANYKKEYVELEAQIRLLKTSIDFGKESDTYIQTALMNKVAAYTREQDALVKVNEITREQADLLIEQFTQIQNLEVEEDRRIDRAKALTAEIKEAGRAMSKLSSFGAGLDKALVTALAQLKALKSGGDAGISGRIAGMRKDVDTKTQSAINAGGDPYGILIEQDEALATIELLEKTLLSVKALQDARKGSSKETGKQAIEKLILEAEHKQKIVALTVEQARYEEILFKAQETNAKKKDPLNQKEIEDAAKKVHLINEQTVALEQQKKVQEDLAKTISSSMETAMMSMVDGTKSVKDAFREMALDIVRHLYKVLVVQQLIRSIGGAIGGTVGGAMSTYGQADGGAWQGGSQIQAYANGGIVGSPTMFGMSGGKTGLMGEAGPEAIMPLKRGANGKLGVQMEGGKGGDNIVIHQNFNFQANGDDTVKKLIAQAAPKIMSMTKTSLIDDRRRGGSTKAAFG